MKYRLRAMNKKCTYINIYRCNTCVCYTDENADTLYDLSEKGVGKNLRRCTLYACATSLFLKPYRMLERILQKDSRLCISTCPSTGYCSSLKPEQIEFDVQSKTQQIKDWIKSGPDQARENGENNSTKAFLNVSLQERQLGSDYRAGCFILNMPSS